MRKPCIRLMQALFAVSALALASGCSLLLDTSECASDSDCRAYMQPGEALSCNTASGRCESAGVECLADPDCATGERCEANACVTNMPSPRDMGMQSEDMNETSPDMGMAPEDMSTPQDMGMVPEDMGTPEDMNEPVDMGPEIVRVNQPIIGSVQWSADKIYILEEIIYVQDQASLNIEAGTEIRGEFGSALIVRRGGKLRANGLPDNPVVFTSAKPVGQRVPGDWGGVALLGNAPTNEPNAVLEGIEDTSKVVFGGSDAEWSCGKLEYVRIEFAGFALDSNKELNALTLAGCGSGTIVDHVHTHFGKDDGLEIFGGTVNISHVLITRAQDDSLDIDRGWKGNAQFIAIQQDANGDNGIEADNWKTSKDAMPRTSPQIYNITIIGPNNGTKSIGMTLKEGVAGTISNGIFMGHPTIAIDIQGDATVAQVTSDNMRVQNSLFFDFGADGMTYFPVEEPNSANDDDNGFDEGMHFRNATYGNVFGQDPRLANPFDLQGVDFRPTDGQRVSGIGTTPPTTADSFFDESATYLGAFAPGIPSWTNGWTSFPDK